MNGERRGTRRSVREVGESLMLGPEDDKPYLGCRRKRESEGREDGGLAFRVPRRAISLSSPAVRMLSTRHPYTLNQPDVQLFSR